jgi:hypothetical protein
VTISREADLSVLAHVQAVSRFLREGRIPLLFLFDEIGTGTDPAEGAALARAILERLLRPGCTTVATTHHGSLKTWAFTTPGAVSAALEFDTEKLRPTYRIVMGAAGVSAGVEIAARLGLDPAVVARSREHLGSAGESVEASMARLRELTSEVEERRRELVDREADLSIERERLASRATAETERRKKEVAAAIDAALREIREEGRRAIAAIEDRKERAKLDRERVRSERRLEADATRRKEEIAAVAGGEAPAALAPPLERAEPGMRVLVRSLGRKGRSSRSAASGLTSGSGRRSSRSRARTCVAWRRPERTPCPARGRARRAGAARAGRPRARAPRDPADRKDGRGGTPGAGQVPRRRRARRMVRGARRPRARDRPPADGGPSLPRAPHPRRGAPSGGRAGGWGRRDRGAPQVVGSSGPFSKSSSQ